MARTKPLSEADLALIEALREDIAKLRGMRSGLEEVTGLEQQRSALQEEIASLQRGQATLVEEHNRATREIEHQVGLQRQQQEFEVDAARREALLEVREGNLEAATTRLEERITFITEGFESQSEFIKGTLEQVLSRLPDVNASLHVGGPVNVTEADGS